MLISVIGIGRSWSPLSTKEKMGGAPTLFLLLVGWVFWQPEAKVDQCLRCGHRFWCGRSHTTIMLWRVPTPPNPKQQQGTTKRFLPKYHPRHAVEHAEPTNDRSNVFPSLGEVVKVRCCVALGGAPKAERRAGMGAHGCALAAV